MEKKLNFIYIMHALDGFSASLISVLIPIYLLNLGFSLYQIFYYYIIYSLGIAFFFIVAGLLATHYGLKKILILRLPFLFTFLFLLHNFNAFTPPLTVLATIQAIYLAFYWFPLHMLFAANSKEEILGSHVGKLYAWPKILSVFAPFLGALITVKFGFKTLFAVCMLFYASSAIPLFFIKDIKTSINFSWKKFISLFKRQSKLFFDLSAIKLSEITEGTIWPIFLFLTFNNILKVGAIATLLGVGSIIFTLFIGKITDKYDSKKMLKSGSLLMIFIWIARYNFNNELIFYILTTLAGFFAIIITIPFNYRFYKNAKKDITDEFIVFSEIFVNLGRILAMLLAMIFISNIKISFLVAAASFLIFLI